MTDANYNLNVPIFKRTARAKYFLLTSLAFLSLATKCGGADPNYGQPVSDAGMDATMMQPCGGPCPSDKRVCDTSTNTCVACLANTDCESPLVRCDLTTKTCSPCAEDCSQNTSKPFCHETAAQCVQCVPANEATACSGKSCDPTTLACTNTTLNSITVCNKCVSDSDCQKGVQGYGDLRCVAMTYQGQPHGNYCLPVPQSNVCPNQYKDKIDATSLSGAPGPVCFPRQTLTTCEAVLSYNKNVTQCTSNATVAACGDPNISDDGLCRADVVSPAADDYKCTYRCGDNNDCQDGFLCNTTQLTKYCCTAGGVSGCH